MTIQLRIRIIIGLMWMTLLAVAVGTALELQQVSRVSAELNRRDLVLVRTSAEMLTALHQPPSLVSTEEFGVALARAEFAAAGDDGEFLERVRSRLSSLSNDSEQGEAGRAAARSALVALLLRASQRTDDALAQIESEALAIAIGLGVLSALVLLAGMWPPRILRVHLFDPLQELNQAVRAAGAGEGLRRVTLRPDGELGQLAQALNHLLDERDRETGELRGRLREVRALLAAVLHRWPHPASVTGLDGEVIVSTLAQEEEQALLNLTPQIRSAARAILSRGFASAEELNTDIKLPSGRRVRLQSLALGERRMVGWLATFHSGPAEDTISRPGKVG